MAYWKRRSGKRNPSHACRWVWQVGFLMVAAFLIHDGYMAVEGHVMAGMDSVAHHAGMTTEHEAHNEQFGAGLAIAIDTIDLVAIDSTDAPAGIPICSTERPAVIVNRDDARQIEPGYQRPTIVSSQDVNSGWQPPVTTAILSRDLPLSRAPDVQRAMFQVYLI